eukprot:TRINITY_DN2212_c0_g1_i1.p1 TRINITY_DN2212_c0_g1~~TRINITY_DN2212_c0_g1_i1.p1  ORF type:complete len:311 (-),score=89.51 TRINITY_DN2212_c0_g1_i1:356-1288(-)
MCIRDRVSTQSTGIFVSKMAQHGEWSWQVAAEHALNTITERRRTLDHDTDQLRATVRNGIESLRRLLDEREAQLLGGVEEVYHSNKKTLDDTEHNITQLRAGLASSADGMQKAVAIGDINNVVVHGKRLEEASGQLKQQEGLVHAMDTGIGGSLPIEATAHSITNLALAGGNAPSAGNATATSYTQSMPPPASQPHYSEPPQASMMTPASGMRSAPPATPATGETVPNAIYVNGVPHDASELDVRETFERFGEIKMINARHISTGGFAFVFFKQDIGAKIALDNPRVVIKGKTANVLAKKQILGGRTSEI